MKNHCSRSWMWTRQAISQIEETLRGVADMTGGEYFLAEDAEQQLDIFLNLPNHVTMQTENREASVIFTALGAILSTLAVGLSLLWNRFP